MPVIHDKGHLTHRLYNSLCDVRENCENVLNTTKVALFYSSASTKNLFISFGGPESSLAPYNTIPTVSAHTSAAFSYSHSFTDRQSFARGSDRNESMGGLEHIMRKNHTCSTSFNKFLLPTNFKAFNSVLTLTNAQRSGLSTAYPT